MTDDWIKLGKRAVACKGWRWMHGMSNSSGEVIDCVDVETGKAYCGEWDADITALPDFQDPATLGCLLALVRKAYCDPSLYVRLSDTRRMSDGVRAWEVLGWLDPSCSPDGRGGSWRGWGYVAEAEALVAALEGAP